MRTAAVAIVAPWWWPAVESDMTPAIAALAAEQGQPVARTSERVWAVLSVMVEPRLPTKSIRTLFPDVAVAEVDPWKTDAAFVSALGSSREVPLARMALERLGATARDGVLPKLPRSRGAQKVRAKDWGDVFARSTLGRDIAFIRGTHRSHAGFHSYKTSKEHEHFSALLEICQRYGMVRTSFSTGSPANASTYEDYAAFLDGGLMSKAGSYLAGLHGAWIVGRTALRFLCFELGLAQPRWPTASAPAPSHDELIRAILVQVATERPLLLERLEEFEAR